MLSPCSVHMQPKRGLTMKGDREGDREGSREGEGGREGEREGGGQGLGGAPVAEH